MDASTTESVRGTVFSIIARHARLEVTTLGGGSTFKDLGISSLTAIEVLFDIEDHFDFEFTEQGANFDAGTLDDLIALVETRIGAAVTPGALPAK